MNQNYKWILGIIQSCKNEFQLNACYALIEFFTQKHNDNNFTQKLFGAIDSKDLELFKQTLAA